MYLWVLFRQQFQTGKYLISLRQFIEAQKAIASPIKWVDEGDNWKVARVALSIDSTAVDGLFLRIKCPAIRSGFGFLLQTEFQPDEAPRMVVRLERIEWRVGHTNSRVGPRNLHLLDMESTHFHRFDLNYVADENRMLQKNLPVAVPVEPDPSSLQDLLDTSEKLLRINGVSGISRPDFQGRLVS